MERLTKKHILMVLGTAVLITSVATHTKAAGTSGAQFLKLGAGARAAAMGEAFASVADDVTATYWNPAGLNQITAPQISAMHNSSILNTQYQYFGAAMPVGKSAMGFSVYRMDYGTIDSYSGSDVKTGSFNASDLAASLTYSHEFMEGFRAGVSGKYISESIESAKATAFAGDLGLHLTQGAFNFGLTVQNLGSGLKFVQKSEALPQTVRFGISRKFFDEKLLGAVEFSKPNDNDGSIHTGLEYNVSPVLALRGGYSATPGNQLDVNGLTGLSGGMGVNLGKFSLDYAFTPFGDLSSTHRVSLLIKFNRFN